MKTTIEVSDPVYRHVKARAALKGQSVKVFLLEAIKEKLALNKGGANVPGDGVQYSERLLKNLL